MNKRILLPALWVMLAALLFAGSAVWYTLERFPRHNSGRLVWNLTAPADKIVIATPKETITLLQENDTWVVKEADYYYADSALINQLFADLRSSTYFHRQPATEDLLSQTGLEDTATRLTAYQNDSPLKSMLIGKTAANRDYRFAREPESSDVWLISGNWQLPGEVYSWLLQPILEYPADLIEKVRLSNGENHGEAIRQAPNLPFLSARKPVTNLAGLLERFGFFIAEKVVSAQNFDEQLYPQRRQIGLTTFSGLVTTVDLYYNQSTYWVKISLSAAPLTTSGVNAYIRENSFLYDGWFFKIPAVNGRILAHYQYN